MGASDQPTGKELAACRTFQKIARQLTKLDNDVALRRPETDLPNEIDFCVRGVRTNGDERLYTVIDCHEKLLAYRRDWRSFLILVTDKMAEIESAVKIGEGAMRPFRRCPDCCTSVRPGLGDPESQKGKPVDRFVPKDETRVADLRRVKTIRTWEDCPTCGGRGMMLKEEGSK